MSEAGQLMAECARRGVQLLKKGEQLFLRGPNEDVDALMPAFEQHLAAVRALVDRWEQAARPPRWHALH